MDQIRNRRDIIEPEALGLALARAMRDVAPGSAAPGSAQSRAAALAVFKRAYDRGRRVVQSRFEAGTSAKLTQASNAYLMDCLIRQIFDFASSQHSGASGNLCVVAVGGYGRGELAPYSDIDLLFLRPDGKSPQHGRVIEFALYLLWDLGLKVGHATRSVKESIRLAGEDYSIRTALLEARLLSGDEALFADFRHRYQKQVVAKTGPDFVEAKLAERDQRHLRLGDSRYMVEPNIKDGKGGLRDLHTLFWIAKYLYRTDRVADLVDLGVLTGADLRRFTKAQSFLWTVRCHLHYLTGRPEERLTFDVQLDMARRMGVGDADDRTAIERFMRRYFLVAKDVGDLTRIFCAALEEKHKKRRPFALFRRPLRKRLVEGFEIEGGRLSIVRAQTLRAEPVKILRLFHLAQERGLDVHPDALLLVRQNLKLVDASLRRDPGANELFMQMLVSSFDPETTLRRLNEAGVLGRFIPDFGRVVARMQHDMYHVYTVDEHTIRAIGLLAKIEKGELAEDHPLANAIVHRVKLRRALYLAVLLHDIAKGRGGDHSILGEGVARALGPRLGLSSAETETVIWLVRWHLLMSATAFKRDLADPKTVVDFVERVQSLERLRLLLVLTVVDIRAVGPSVWNAWKGQLLRELYQRAEEMLSGGLGSMPRAERVAAAKSRALEKLADWPEPDRDAFAARHFDNYWLNYPDEDFARHARMMREADRAKAPLTIKYRADPANAVTEMTIYAADHPGLFARFAGAIAVSGANIVSAKIATTRDGMALDSFLIQDSVGGAVEKPDRLVKLSAAVERTLSGALLPRLEISPEHAGVPSRANVFTVEPVVRIDDTASRAFTLIEVQARDRPGLLYDVTRALYDLSLAIGSARVATYGLRAVDVFYVTDLTGNKVTDRARLGKIEKRLLKTLAQPAGSQAQAGAQAATKAPGKAQAAE